MDGNRRWAAFDGAGGRRPRPPPRCQQDRRPAGLVRRRGGVQVVTLFMLSTDNLRRRPSPSSARCCGIIKDVAVESPVPGRAAGGRSTPWARPTCCRRRPSPFAQAGRGGHPGPAGGPVNLAVGYGGRREIADAVRSLLSEHAARGTSLDDLVEVLEVEHIAEHLYTRGAARLRPGDPHQRRAAHLRLPAVADRERRVPLHRCLLARLPPGRLPARAARLLRARATLGG